MYSKYSEVGSATLTMDHYKNSSLSVPLKALLVLFCSCMSTSVALLIRGAEHNDKLLFSPMAASFLAELIKLCIGFGLMLPTLRKSLKQIRGISWSDLRLFFVPAFFFATSNNLRFVVMKAVNPGLVSVIWNLKIVVVGLMYQIPPCNRPLSLRQWVGAGLLVVGATIAKLSEDGSIDSDGESNSGGRFGLLLLMIQLVLAACAGVCTEYAYKSTADRIDFPAQCSILYAFGASLNLIAFIVAGLTGNDNTSMQDSASQAKVEESFPRSLFSGFDLWSWLAIFSIACSGFVVGMIFKYLDSVAQVRSRNYCLL